MKSKYEQIVEAEGEMAAKEYMRSLRARVKKPSGVASLPEAKRKRIMAKARAARKNNVLE